MLMLVCWNRCDVMCRYLLSLDKHPVATKAVTSALLNMAGDLICQVRLVLFTLILCNVAWVA
jgi:hypothetical protein